MVYWSKFKNYWLGFHNPFSKLCTFFTNMKHGKDHLTSVHIFFFENNFILLYCQNIGIVIIERCNFGMIIIKIWCFYCWKIYGDFESEWFEVLGTLCIILNNLKQNWLLDTQVVLKSIIVCILHTQTECLKVIDVAFLSVWVWWLKFSGRQKHDGQRRKDVHVVWW